MQAVVGVDPHKRVFSAVALDSRGGRLGKWTGGTTRRAIVELQTWASDYASGAVGRSRAPTPGGTALRWPSPRPVQMCATSARAGPRSTVVAGRDVARVMRSMPK